MKVGRTTKYVSVSLSPQEEKHLDECVAASGKVRNRWLRDLIASQKPGPAKGQPKRG